MTQQGQSGVTSVKPRKKIDPQRRKEKKRNRLLVRILLAVTAAAAVALLVNVILVARTTTGSGSETSLTVDTQRSMKNDQYEIGNNPTDFEKECFQKLTDALSGGSDAEIAEAVVYNFVSDYFTWSNKDGNYEVGGLQYWFSDKTGAMEDWSRYNYYKDLDLYISQYGRENLPAVASINTDVATFQTDDFLVATMDPQTSYPCYQVQVSWTYTMGSSVPSSNFVNEMRFQVVNHDGRFEIVEFYDMDSVRAWEAANGSSASASAESEG